MGTHCSRVARHLSGRKLEFASIGAVTQTSWCIERDPHDCGAWRSITQPVMNTLVMHQGDFLIDTTRRTWLRFSHEVRQPLTVLRLNLRTLDQLLTRPTPVLDEALSVLEDCVAAEYDLTRLTTSFPDSSTAASRPTSSVNRSEIGGAVTITSAKIWEAVEATRRDARAVCAIAEQRCHEAAMLRQARRLRGSEGKGISSHRATGR